MESEPAGASLNRLALPSRKAFSLSARALISGSLRLCSSSRFGGLWKLIPANVHKRTIYIQHQISSSVIWISEA
jgi:hypothetical protein